MPWASFSFLTGVKAMKDMFNLRAAAMTRSRQIATNAIKQKFRDEGRHLRDFRISDHATAITELSNDPTILAKATADVERWFGAKFRNSAQRKRR
jgi:hypothetical protein